MKALIACEFSGRVRDAFIARGHVAVSIDYLPTEAPGPHVQGDELDGGGPLSLRYRLFGQRGWEAVTLAESVVSGGGVARTSQ